MPRSDLIVELSNELLTKFFHNAVGGGLIRCPKPPVLVTDVVVNGAMAIRGDDTTFDGTPWALTNIEAALRKNKVDKPDVPKEEDVTIVKKGGSETIKVPSLYLTVSGSMRSFKEADLDRDGTSEKSPAIEFSSSSPGSAGLLFQVVQSRTLVSGGSVMFHLKFISLWNAALIVPGDFLDLITWLRNELNEVSVPLPLGGVGGVFQGGGSITNVLATTDFFPHVQGDLYTPAPDQQTSRGLRLGMDLSLPPDASRWKAFASGTALSIAKAEKWGVSASSDLLTETARKLVGSAIS